MNEGVAISFNNVSKRYPNGKGIFNVNLIVKAGEIYGFLGPNGAGKTTAIRTLMDFMRPDGGYIKVLNFDSKINSVEIKKIIGYVPADKQMYDKLSGKEHVKLYSTNRINNAFSLAKRLKLDLKTPVKHLSSGNKQKLAVILALIGDPKILVMDEPTAGLDPLFQQEIYDILKEFKNNGGSVFLSSHNLPEVEKICDRVGVIKEGKIVAEKTMQDIRDMSIHIIDVHTKNKLSIKKSKSVEITKHTDNHTILKVKGDLNTIIKQLAGQNITDLEVTHASLEDIFMEYYS